MCTVLGPVVAVTLRNVGTLVASTGSSLDAMAKFGRKEADPAPPKPANKYTLANFKKATADEKLGLLGQGAIAMAVVKKALGALSGDKSTEAKRACTFPKPGALVKGVFFFFPRPASQLEASVTRARALLVATWRFDCGVG